jgi:hypothetical protein
LDALYAGELSWGDVFVEEEGGFESSPAEDTPLPEVDMGSPLPSH